MFVELGDDRSAGPQVHAVIIVGLFQHRNQHALESWAESYQPLAVVLPIPPPPMCGTRFLTGTHTTHRTQHTAYNTQRRKLQQSGSVAEKDETRLRQSTQLCTLLTHFSAP